jgi:hypothetical protein
MTASRKRITKMIQEAIDRGATTVEDIHKSVADLPLRILEERDSLRRPAKEVRRVQDRFTKHHVERPLRGAKSQTV